MFSVGGAFELGATIAQPDARLLTGGDFTLSGGFWFPAPSVCLTCPGDMNGDTRVDGDDIEAFVAAVLNGSNQVSAPCADMDGNGVLESPDIGLFVARLLGLGPNGPDSACP